jgi:signal transduction histidine kinase
MQTVLILIVLITVISNLLLGYIILRNNSKSTTHRLLAFITLIIALWSVANYYSLNSLTPSQTLFWIRVVMVITAPLAPTIFLFLSTFPGEKFKLKKTYLYLIGLLTVFTAIISATPLTFSGVSLEGGVKPTIGFGIVFYGLLTIYFLAAGFWVIFSKYRSSQGKVRLQLKYIVLGAILTFTLQAVTNYLLVVLFNYSNFVAFGPTFSLILVGSMTYAIVRHNLLDVKVVLVQILTAVILIVLFSRIFTFQSPAELIVDSIVFAIVFVFGVLLVRSVMREIKHRESLEDFTKKLKELDKQKDEFISMAAHELRAPMTAIKGYISMVTQGDAGEITEKARGFLADANAINDRLVRLVNNMLNVSRIEEGRMVFQLETEELSHVVRAVYSQFVPEAERKGLKYTLDIPKHIRDKVEVDPDRIHEVMANFLSNALKYTDEGTISVTMLQPKEDTVRVEVKDTGPGISKPEQQKLFQKFYRVETNVGKTTGTGLGLYISKLLVDKFGGKIGLDSDVGKGSTFWFELPIAKEKEKN